MQEKVDSIINDMIECFPFPYYVIEEDKIIYCNHGALRVFGYEKKEELIGLCPYNFSPETQPDGESSEKKGKEMIKKVKEKGFQYFHWLHQKKNGELFNAEIFLYFKKGLIFAVVNDIDLLKQLKDKKNEMEKEIEELTMRDYLTGFYNKKYFIEKLKDLLQISDVNKDRFGLFFIDFDNFKDLNDTLGHLTGDKVISEAARRIKTVITDNALLARYGGDEFIILVHNVYSKDELYSLAQKVFKSLTMLFTIDEHEFYLSVSIGIAYYPFDGEDVDTLLKNADIAMYKAKENKGDGYNIQVFSMEMKNDVHEHFLIATYLRKALEKEEFYLCFQPIVNLKTNRVEAAEALLRWKNAVLGYIPPDKFISIAEEIGVIHDIGEYVLKKVCNFIKNIREKELKTIPISVNISTKQLENKKFAQRVKNIIDSYGIDGRFLEFEITESVSAGNMSIIVENIQKIKELGIKIAMDDFGTGYSSLAMLLNLQVDKIKIDKIFVDNIGERKNRKIIKIVVCMALELALGVVAEGIEMEDQLLYLRSLNCEYGQGYLFSKPVPIQEFETYLRNNK